MRKLLKRFVCKHKWEAVRKVEKFSSLAGEQLYRRCEKCGKIEKYIYRYYEGNGYKQGESR